MALLEYLQGFVQLSTGLIDVSDFAKGYGPSADVSQPQVDRQAALAYVQGFLQLSTGLIDVSDFAKGFRLSADVAQLQVDRQAVPLEYVHGFF